MPKHVHRFYRQDTESKSKYMWKCTDCGWFVHAGLEYVMIGKPGVCWSCDSTFTITNTSLLQDKPRCADCMVGGGSNEALEKLKRRANGIEVIEEDEVHSPECDVHIGGECTCR